MPQKDQKIKVCEKCGQEPAGFDGKYCFICKGMMIREQHLQESSQKSYFLKA